MAKKKKNQGVVVAQIATHLKYCGGTLKGQSIKNIYKSQLTETVGKASLFL